MALWDDERRILAEIEQRLSQDDPALAETMHSFGEGEPAPRESGGGTGGSWKPWIMVGLIVTMVIGLLAVLVSVSLSSAGGSGAQNSAPQVVAPQTEPALR